MTPEEYTDKMIELRQKLAVTKEKVMYAALKLAACQYADDTRAETGWEADMYEELFDEAITMYAVALADVKHHERTSLREVDNATEE